MWEYFRKSEGRWYAKWRNSGDRKIYSKRRAVYFWEQVNGNLPKGYEIHHINFNKSDDRVENLQCLKRSEHRFLHARLIEDHKFIDGIENRRCQFCKEYKQLIEFAIRNGGTYQGYCKSCSKSKLQQWRESNREHHNKYHREYRKK